MPAATDSPLPPQPIHPLRETGAVRADWQPVSTLYAPGVPLCIDLGSSTTRIGLANAPENPTRTFPTLVARWRDRKAAATYTMVGNDVYRDAVVRTAVRLPFDGPLLTNWEAAESVLDYLFEHLGVTSSGKVDNPVVVLEVLGAPLSVRAGLYQLLFEAYDVPAVAYGLDSLFAYHANGGARGVVVGTGHEATTVIPVWDAKGVVSQAKRINYGGRHASSYLNALLGLKYPYFPAKVTSGQAEAMVQDHCFVAGDYNAEVSKALDLDVLEDFDRVVEAPFVEVAVAVKTEAELAAEADRRKESGRRLQQQAQKMRAIKLEQRQMDYVYMCGVKEQLEVAQDDERAVERILATEQFDTLAEFKKYFATLEKAVKKASGEEEPVEAPTFPLLEIPDVELLEEQLKEKRKQRLMKANLDARTRARAEKEAEAKRAEDEKKAEEEWRQRDLAGWIASKRERLATLVENHHRRTKLAKEVKNRKSKALQQRMKNLAMVADDSGGKRRRTQTPATVDKDPNDTFGANDDDWAVYRDINLETRAEDLAEVEADERAELLQLEAELLEHDEAFTPADTFDNLFDWRGSTLHRFFRGPRPADLEDVRQQHQLHLNVERIRVPEAFFQPAIAGIDQAGVGEVVADLLLRRSHDPVFGAGAGEELLKDVFVTGGPSLLPGFVERVEAELRLVLPSHAPLAVRRARDPLNDAWRGMALWAASAGRDLYVLRAEYLEMGADYIKEHGMGNAAWR